MYKLKTYSEIVIFILKQLRGDLSQLEMSMKLNKKYNIYQKYEAQDKRIKLSDFVLVCETLNIDIRHIFNHSFEINTINTSTSKWVNSLLSTYPHIDDKDVASHLKISKTSWWRIIKGTREIYLDEFLLLSNYQTQRLNIFLNKLNINIPEKFRSKLYNQADKLHLKYIYTPELSLIGAAIYLKKVKNAKTIKTKIKNISNACYLPEYLVRNVISELIDENILYINKDNNFEFNYFENTFYSKREKAVFNSLKKFSIEQLKEQSQIGLKSTDRFHIRTACVSKKANKEIDDIITECALKVSKVINKDPADNREVIISFLTSKITK